MKNKKKIWNENPEKTEYSVQKTIEMHMRTDEFGCDTRHQPSPPKEGQKISNCKHWKNITAKDAVDTVLHLLQSKNWIVTILYSDEVLFNILQTMACSSSGSSSDVIHDDLGGRFVCDAIQPSIAQYPTNHNHTNNQTPSSSPYQQIV